MFSWRLYDRDSNAPNLITKEYRNKKNYRKNSNAIVNENWFHEKKSLYFILYIKVDAKLSSWGIAVPYVSLSLSCWKIVAFHRWQKKELSLEACSINFNSEEYRQELRCKQKLKKCAVSYERPEEDRSLSRWLEHAMKSCEVKKWKKQQKRWRKSKRWGWIDWLQL